MYKYPKQPLPQLEPQVETAFQTLSPEALRTELLNPKADASRYNWLIFVLRDMMTPKGMVGGGENFDEILMQLLADKKNPKNYVKACEVATLATLWGMELKVKEVEDAMYDLLCSDRHQNQYGLQILNSLLMLLLTESPIPTTLIEGIMKSDIAPKIHHYADRLTEKLHGHTIPNEYADFDETVVGNPDNLLLNYLAAFQACIANMSEESTIFYIKDLITSLIVLLDHPTDLLRIQAAHAMLSVVDMAERCHLDISHHHQEAVKAMKRIIANHDVDWGNGDSRKVFEQLAEMIETNDVVVIVEKVILSATPHKGQKMSAEDVLFYKAHSTKKGHPVSGYADAAVIDFFHSYLGETFNEFFNSDKEVGQRNNSRTIKALYDIASRHPAAKASAEHMANHREYGTSVYLPKSSEFEPRSRQGKKVNVADYI